MSLADPFGSAQGGTPGQWTTLYNPKRVIAEANSDGHHLFTLLASLRALQAGSLLARRLWDKGAADFYTAQADMLAQRLQDFRAKDGTWRESMLSDQGSLLDLSQAEGEERQPQAGSFKPLDRTGLDCAVPLAAVHFGSAGQAEFEMSAGQADVLATLREWILSFGGLYRINDGKKWTEGCGVGRYAEDVYNGVGTSRGNPWYVLSSSSSAWGSINGPSLE